MVTNVTPQGLSRNPDKVSLPIVQIKEQEEEKEKEMMTPPLSL